MAKKPKAPPPSDASTAPYRKVYITVWHDPTYKKLSVNAQHVYTLLCTGPQTESLPLLQMANAGILEAHAPSLGYDNIKAGLAELRTAGLVDYADDAPVIALPRYCTEEPCKSYKMLTGWLKVYQRIPDGDIKSKHTATLKSMVDFTADSAENPLRSTWDNHFKGTPNGGPAGGSSDTPFDTLSHTLPDTSKQLAVSSDQDQESERSEQPPPPVSAADHTAEPAAEVPRYDSDGGGGGGSVLDLFLKYGNGQVDISNFNDTHKAELAKRLPEDLKIIAKHVAANPPTWMTTKPGGGYIVKHYDELLQQGKRSGGARKSAVDRAAEDEQRQFREVDERHARGEEWNIRQGRWEPRRPRMQDAEEYIEKQRAKYEAGE